MGYMKKILGWLPRKYLLLIAIGMSLTALDGIIIPSFISGLIDVSATQKVEDLVKIPRKNQKKFFSYFSI